MKRLEKSAAFIISAHRSGSTLLRFLLDSHPDIACPPESKFISGLAAFCAYPQVLAALGSLGVTEDDLWRELRRSIVRVLSAYARRAGKKMWVDKTPNYTLLLPFIDQIFAHDAKYILLVRHPLDSILSLERMPAFRREVPQDPDVARVLAVHGRGRHAWAAYWLEMNRRIHVWRQENAQRTVLVRYEDLVRQPEVILHDVFAFLGVPHPSSACDLVRAAFTQEHGEGFEDPMIRGTRGIHQQSVGTWGGLMSSEEQRSLWAVVADCATSFGYGLERAEQARHSLNTQGE